MTMAMELAMKIRAYMVRNPGQRVFLKKGSPARIDELSCGFLRCAGS
jgi:hypothetical protein